MMKMNYDKINIDMVYIGNKWYILVDEVMFRFCYIVIENWKLL